MRRTTDSTKDMMNSRRKRHMHYAVLAILLMTLTLNIVVAFGATTNRFDKFEKRNSKQIDRPEAAGRRGYDNNQIRPFPPQGLHANVSYIQDHYVVELSWIEVAFPDGFVIERQTLAPFRAWEPIGINGTSNTTFTDIIQQGAVEHHYRVSAYRGSLYSDYSNVVEVRFGQP